MDQVEVIFLCELPTLGNIGRKDQDCFVVVVCLID